MACIRHRIRKSDGKREYYIDFRVDVDGKRRRVTETVGTTRKLAEKLLAKRQWEILDGSYTHPDEAKRQAAREVTLGEFAKRFMRNHAAGCRSDHYQDRLPRLIESLGRDRPIREIRRANIERFKADRLTQVSGSTVRKDLAAAATLFKKAVEWDVIDASPVAGVKKPPPPKHKTRYLSPGEWERLQAHAPAWLRPILTMTVQTGMRLKEVVGLRWEDVDWPMRQVHIAEDTKTGHRTIPLNAIALDLLKAQDERRQEVLADRDRRRQAARGGDSVAQHRAMIADVFIDDEGQPYTSPAARNKITRVTIASMRAAGIAGATFHSLRHTAASWMVQSGADLYQVQRILGHSTSEMTQRYAHLQPDHLRSAVDAIAALADPSGYRVDSWADAAPDADSPALAISPALR